LQSGKAGEEIRVEPPDHLTVWLQRDRVRRDPFRHRVLLSGTSGLLGSTDSLWLLTFSTAGARLELLYRQEGKQVRIVDEPWSPDESSIAFLVRTAKGERETSTLTRTFLEGAPRTQTVTQDERSWSDLRIEWKGSEPVLGTGGR
jgi:hypothetical protein